MNDFSNTVTQKVGELNTKIAQVETSSDLVMSASEKLIAGYQLITIKFVDLSSNDYLIYFIFTLLPIIPTPSLRRSVQERLCT